MKSKSLISYHVTYEGSGSTIAQDTYSKYHERLFNKHDGTLDGDVYGYEQALEHVEQLKKSHLWNAGVQFQIEIRFTGSTFINC